MATDPTTDGLAATAEPSRTRTDDLVGPGPSAPPPASDDATGAWVTVSRRVEADDLSTAIGPRRVVVRLLLGVLAAVLLVSVLGTLAARQLAEREAVNDAATMANVLAEAVVQPALSPDLLDGDQDALDLFDVTMRRSVLSDQVVRVKIWTPEGRVAYADEPALVGRTFPLDDGQRAALAGPQTVAEVTELDESENAFEQGDRLVEVYRPVWTDDGRTALFEMYVSYAPVADRTQQLWRGFAGVTASSLLLLVVIVTPLVVHLVRRLRQAERQRLALLQRAVEASEAERRRIAATLHDGPVQELAATSFTVAGASATAASEGRTALAADLGSAAAAVRGSIRSLRTLLVDIYPPSLERSGVVAALHDLAQEVRSDDVDVRVDADPEDELALVPEAARVVHRVAQECLRNAGSHAGAATVTVSLRRTDARTVTMDVVDDGRGFDVDEVLARPADGHFGTRLLADATSVPGALLRVATAPGHGTHWQLRLDGPLGVRA